MKSLNDRPEFAAARDERASELGKRTGPVNLTRYNKSATHRAKASETGKRTIHFAIEASRGPRPHYRGSRNPNARKDITVDRIREVASRSQAQREVLRELICSQKVLYRVLREAGLSWKQLSVDGCKGVAAAERCRQRKPWLARKPGNHTVVSVEEAGYEDVYCISVEGTRNFALDAGVFVHNCDAVAGVVYSLSTLDLPIRTMTPDKIFEATEGLPTTIEEQGLHDIVGTALKRDHIEGIDPPPLGMHALPVKPKPGRSLSSGQSSLILQMARWGRGGE